MKNFFNKLSNFKIALLLLSIILVVNIDIVVASLNYYFSYFDLKDLRYFVNIRQYSAQCLLSGIFPLWTTKIFCGVPFFASSETAVLYPLNIIFLLLPISKAINFTFLIHLFIFSLGIFLWIDNKIKDKLVSVIVSVVSVFISCTYFHFYAGHISNVITMAWFPMLLYFYDKSFNKNSYKYIVPITILICLQIFAGHFQYTYYSALVSLIYVLFYCRNKKTIVTIFVSYFCALLLCAVQILPSIDFYLEGMRRHGSLDWFCIYSSFKYLVTLIFPKYTELLISHFWESANYFGLFSVLTILFVIFNKYNKNIFKNFCLVLLIYFMTFKMFSYISAVVPFFNNFRSPIKLMFFAIVLLLPILAYGIQQILDNETKVNKYVVLSLLVVSILIVLFRNYFVYIIFDKNVAVINKNLEIHILNTGILIALFSALLLLKRYTISKILLISLIIVQPIVYVKSYSKSFLLNFPNKNIVTNFDDRNSDTRFFNNDIYDMTLNDENISGSASDILSNFSIFSKKLIFPINANNIFGLVRLGCITEQGEITYTENKTLNRINVFYDYAITNNRPTILDLLNSNNFDAFNRVILEKDPLYKPYKQGKYNLKILELKENSIEFECETTEPAIILITDNYEKGWTAFDIDTKEKYEVVCADYIYKAISVNDGKHKIRLEYKPKVFFVGLYVSIISLILFVLCCLLGYTIKSHKAK